ncbi:hypothetical protein GCM10010435_36340 [Winogradskya consettensis]|uniref:Uncharacterized protein n=1 Tax=Winogradskya consettensis TaxID=113560 RepID=A0A919W0H8_9ACTN|nr:hypothetical protein Aco04nite_77910 [Actinoplanes consettensis]
MSRPGSPRALGIAWEERDSDYRGRYFQSPGPPSSGGRLLLQANDLRDETGDHPQLPDHPDHRYLLFVTSPHIPTKRGPAWAVCPNGSSSVGKSWTDRCYDCSATGLSGSRRSPTKQLHPVADPKVRNWP